MMEGKKMKTSEYENLVKKIDSKLKNGSFNFQYESITQEWERNAFTGLKINNIIKWEDAVAIRREEQMIIDSNGVSHSILGDKLKL